MKQTAVEWFNDEIIIHLNFDQRLYLKDIFKQALKIEKEQMILFYLKGCDDSYGIDEPCPIEDYDRKEAEEYYNEIFKNETK